MRHPARILACIALVSGCSSAPSTIRETVAPAPSRETLGFTPIQFETREGAKRRVDAEEAYLVVPARRDSADGRTMRLRVVRFRSTAPNPGPPIVYLAGGPGGSASLSAAGDRFDWFQALREVGDVIAFDQRGTFGTTPYPVCPGAWSYPLDQPLMRDTLAAVLRRFAPACVAHWAEKGVDFRDFNTEENADDVDALRSALGVPQISLVGISYGTHLALSVMRRHPRSIARVVLAGVEGPDHSLKLPSNLDRTFERLDSLAAADPSRAGAPRLTTMLRDALARLSARPVTVPVPGKGVSVTIGALDLQLTVAQSLGKRTDMEGIVAAAPAIARGEFAALASAVYARRVGKRELAMAIATDCSSGASPARLARIASEAPRSLLGDVINLPYPDMCDAWPHRRLRDEFRTPLRSDTPTLFVSGTLDGRTPASNAIEVAQGFTNARHLTIVNGSHDDDLLIASPAIGAAMRAFLAGREPASLLVTLPPLRLNRR